jgi:peptidoglycan/LPS O-acetylase OafA/YrhL
MESVDKPQARADRFYVPQLDGLRFFAFLLVFIHHFSLFHLLFAPGSLLERHVGLLQHFGWCGVDLFLVLSAYLITTLLLLEYDRHKDISLRGFYLRRMLRIWPLYYLMTAACFYLFPRLGFFAPPWASAQHVAMIKDYALPYFTLFGNYAVGTKDIPRVLTLAVMWTVTLEEQFYIVWPLLFWALLRLRRAVWWIVLGALLALSIGLRAYFHSRTVHPFLWTYTPARLDPLVMGIVVAVWRHSHPPRPGWIVPAIKLLLGGAAVCAIALAPGISSQSKAVVWQFLATAVGFAVILDAVLCLSKNPFSWLLARRPLVWLGKLTYGLYVYHMLGVQAAEPLTAALHPERWLKSTPATVLLRCAIALGLTITAAALSYRFFESYFLRLKDRFSRVKSRPVAKNDRPSADAPQAAAQ